MVWRHVGAGRSRPETSRARPNSWNAPCPEGLTHWSDSRRAAYPATIASVIRFDGDHRPVTPSGQPACVPFAFRAHSRAACTVGRGWLRDGPGPSTRAGGRVREPVQGGSSPSSWRRACRRVRRHSWERSDNGARTAGPAPARFPREVQLQRFPQTPLAILYPFSRHSYSPASTGVIMTRRGRHTPKTCSKRSTEREVNLS